MTPSRILIVDDDRHARDFLSAQLAELGEIEAVEDAPTAVKLIEGEAGFDLVLTDMAMPDPGDGLKVLAASRRRAPETPVLVLTAFGNIEGALETIQQGAWDYIAKPFDPDTLVHAARRALEQRRLVVENRQLRSRAQHRMAVVGKSPALLEVYKQVARAAASRVPVLITGETGTGKEQVARALHARSDRPEAPFIPVDCGAISEPLMESELFGHARGAFTGASGARRGLFEEADGGTLFLDEIGDVGPKIQSLLLRALQEGEIRRVGESTPVKVDVRVIAATNKDLSALVREGRFREDLLYRLDVVHLRLPPLRQRKEDIPLLVEHVSGLHARAGVRPVVTPEAMQLLVAHDWPGNIRQLENVIARALALNGTGVIEPGDLPGSFGGRAETADTAGVDSGLAADLPSLAVLSRRYASLVLQRVGGNKSEAARLLGVDRKTLYRLIGPVADGERSP